MTDPTWLTRREGGVLVAVKAVPRASRTGVAGEQAGALRVRTTGRSGSSRAGCVLSPNTCDRSDRGTDRSRIRLTELAAAPHKGEANAALIAFLADAAGCRPSAARLRRGSGGAPKLVELDGDPEALAARLAAMPVP